MLRVISRRTPHLLETSLATSSRLPAICRHKIIRSISYAADLGSSEEPGIDDAPVLRVVRQRADQRIRLLSELSDDMSSKDDIARIREIRALEPLSQAWDVWKKDRMLLEENRPLMSDPDPEFCQLAQADDKSLRGSLSLAVSTTFPNLLLADSPTRKLGALVEFKGGVGGAESGLFLSEMFRMYERLASAKGFEFGVLSKSELDTGGLREAVVEVKGEGAYDLLKTESGVHRVQRVPATETGGRTHTSTVALVVLPLIEDAESPEAPDDIFDMADVKLEVMRARGAGGQHVNKTESAVRLTHLPTGITVSMQDQRSQHQNRRRAFQILRARLLDVKMRKEEQERRDVRRNLVKGADRSEKVRTYNFPQDRVTDHRIGFSIKNAQAVMEGDALEEILDKLKEQAEKEALEDMMERGTCL